MTERVTDIITSKNNDSIENNRKLFDNKFKNDVTPLNQTNMNALLDAIIYNDNNITSLIENINTNNRTIYVGDYFPTDKTTPPTMNILQKISNTIDSSDNNLLLNNAKVGDIYINKDVNYNPEDVIDLPAVFICIATDSKYQGEKICSLWLLLNTYVSNTFDENSALAQSGKAVANAIKNVTNQVLTIKITKQDTPDIDAIETEVTNLEITPITGDIAIIKRNFGSADNERTSYTAYVFNGENWTAMDGNYSATNVFFDEDLITTSAIGNITLTNGQATIPANGKNLKEVFEAIFVKEDTDITVTKPAVHFASPTSGTPKYYCIGDDASLSVVLSFDDGNYEYGYTTEIGEDGDSSSTYVNNGTTGVSLNATEPYVLKNGSTKISPTETNGNSFNVEVTGKTAKASVSVKASANYGNGNAPISNLKKMYPSKKITAGTTDEVTKELFRWYVPMYHGFKYGKDDDLISNYTALTATQVEGLSMIEDSTAYNQTKPTSASADDSWRQYFVAIPTSYNSNKPSAKDSNNLTLTVEEGAQVTLEFNGTKIVYDVYYIHNAAAYDTVDITLTW